MPEHPSAEWNAVAEEVLHSNAGLTPEKQSLSLSSLLCLFFSHVEHQPVRNATRALSSLCLNSHVFLYVER